MSKIGFIGLGIMGTPMSQNLKKAGYDVMVSDLVEARLQQAKEAGLEVAADSAQVARECDMIITMLPNSPTSSPCCAVKTVSVSSASPAR